MYLYQTINDRKSMQGDGFLVPTFPQSEVNKSDRLEIWASSFTDAGSDRTEFRLMNGTKIVSTKTMMGY